VLGHVRVALIDPDGRGVVPGGRPRMSRAVSTMSGEVVSGQWRATRIVSPFRA
jgi:hypothetical protein